MIRTIANELTLWKERENRLSLLVRGARQVGKTYSVRELGKTFTNFVEVNFEEHPEVAAFFDKNLDPARLCETLSAYYRTPISPGMTLLFFDEIQSCPKALHALRFFHEKMPELHLIAAGSLLEFALQDLASFGVGRITSLYMYPLSFSEFLRALDEDRLLDMVNNATGSEALYDVFHHKLISYVRCYQMIGGLPAVVKHYIDTRDLNGCTDLLDALITTYQDDFAKYKQRAPVQRLRRTFQSFAYQTGQKFKYSRVEDAGAREIKQSVDLLVQAGLAYKIYSSSAQGIPLGAQANEKRFKVLLFDVGIYQRLLGLDPGHYIVMDDATFINKGASSELFVGLELIKANRARLRPELYYWHREQKNSNAEVDYVVSQQDKIVAIEVKSGSRGSMQSLWRFLDTHPQSPYGVRLALEPFSSYARKYSDGTEKHIKVIPLYATHHLAAYR